MTKKSKGHVAFIGPFEYVERGGELYRGRVEGTYLDVWGYRSGLRWECPMWMADRALDLARQAFGQEG
jgi:hypothetical protein